MYQPAPTPAYTAATTRSTGPSAAAWLLVGVIVGGVAGGATATLLDGRSPAELVPTPVPSAIASSAPVTVPAGADPIVDVAKEMLPSVVTVVNRLASGQQQSSGSGFVIDARGYVVTNNHVVENARGGGVGALVRRDLQRQPDAASDARWPRPRDGHRGPADPGGAAT